MGWKLDSAGKWLIDAAGKALLCNCCNDGEQYWRGRSCDSGDLVDYWIDGHELPEGTTCVTIALGGGDCIEFFTDYPRTDTEPEEDELLTPDESDIGRSCCRCAAGCLKGLVDIAHPENTCCCGKANAVTASQSDDCEWRVLSYTWTRVQTVLCSGDPITKTVIATGGPSAWVKIGQATGNLPGGTTTTTYSPANACYSDSIEGFEFSLLLACSEVGHPIFGGTTPWYRSGEVFHASPGTPGCLTGASMAVSDTSGGGVAETIELSWEVRCSGGLTRPCRDCDAKGAGGYL